MQEEIKEIKERNQRVEADKAWEISFTRRAIIAVMTYLIVVVFLITNDFPYPYLNALIPTIGFILSTLTLKFFKKTWINRVYKK